MTKAIFAITTILCFSFSAEARRSPEKVFRGQILFSKKAFPRSANSASAYIKKLKKQRKKSLWENKETKEYKMYFAAFFKKPLNTLEITVRIYDISTKRKVLLTSFAQYLSKKGMTSYISKFKLSREDIGANKDLLIVLESRGKTMASGKIRILGEREKFKGKVDFSADET